MTAKIKGTKGKNKIILIAAFLLLVIFVVGFLFLKGKNITEAEEIILDEYPIWLMREGKVAVYREMIISKDKLEKTIVIKNLTDEKQEGIKIYEIIPKEIAASASELNFSIQPDIIEDDPVVLWNIGRPKGVVTSEEKQKSGMEEVSSIWGGLGRLVIGITRNVGIAYLTDTCEGKAAQQHIDSYLAEKGSGFGWLDGCANYIHDLEKKAVEKTSDEWQNKMEENAVYKSLEPGTDEYQRIKSKIKQSKQVSEPSSKISREEALAIVEEEFADALKGLGPDSDFKDATCQVSYDNSENRWHVVCQRPPYEFGYSDDVCDFHYHFYSVSNDGQTKKEGWYANRRHPDGSEEIMGEPKWGII